MSPRRFFVNSTLPAPMNTIRGLMRGSVPCVGYKRARVRTTAESRALQQLTTADGWLAIVANDQRQSLVALREQAGLPATAEELRQLKADIVAALGRDASGVLLDPEFALPALVDEGVVPRDTGILVATERSGPQAVDGLRVADVLLAPTDVRRLGGTAAKLLVYVRPDHEDAEGPNGRLVSRLAEACAAADLLLFVEVLTYRRSDEDPAEYGRRKTDLGLEAALLVESCGARVLKLESPGSEPGCRRLTEALTVPWALLSAGVDHETFKTTLQAAVAGGASGFIAGRSLWKEAALLQPPERRAFLLGEGRRRLAELLALLP
ncbi:MAG: tagatose-bisphosphate aldolase [Chloroflexi bacterium]|nr:MAG: tagatose-bisphosphate aldolase [Chloroflexota bacterium]